MEPDPAAQAKLEDILHPRPTAETFRITIIFGQNPDPRYKKAVLLAKRNPSYREEGEGEGIRHSAVYTPAEVDDLFDLFNIVHDWEKTEILVNHKPLPYGHQLWLPLMWFHRIK
ncbi:MAG: hypothetical protein ACYDH3_06120 [Candidatus Aminicenantales bacterium]